MANIRVPKFVWVESPEKWGRRASRVQVQGVTWDDHGQVASYLLGEPVADGVDYVDDEDDDDYTDPYGEYEEYERFRSVGVDQCWLTKKEALAAIPRRKAGRRARASSVCMASCTAALKALYTPEVMSKFLSEVPSVLSKFLSDHEGEHGLRWVWPVKKEVVQ